MILTLRLFPDCGNKILQQHNNNSFKSTPISTQLTTKCNTTPPLIAKSHCYDPASVCRSTKTSYSITRQLMMKRLVMCMRRQIRSIHTAWQDRAQSQCFDWHWMDKVYIFWENCKTFSNTFFSWTRLNLRQSFLWFAILQCNLITRSSLIYRCCALECRCCCSL